MKRLENWFLAALVANGIGSSVVFVLLPYWLLHDRTSQRVVFVTTALLTGSGVAGAWFWGRFLDGQSSPWRTRLFTLTCEVLASVLFCACVLLKLPSVVPLFVLASILEFLFAYELIWSRIAWRELTVARGQASQQSARRFSVSASLISVVGPALGVLGGLHGLLWQAALINAVSAIPYAWICIQVLKAQPSGAQVTSTADAAPSYRALARFLAENGHWLNLLLGFIAVSVCSTTITVVLPVVLFGSAKDPHSISLFYLATSALTAMSGVERVSAGLARLGLQKGRLLLACCLTGLGFLASSGQLWVQAAFYLVFNILWMKISIELLGLLYREELNAVRGRFMGLLRVVTQSLPPLVSLGFALVSAGHLIVLASAVVGVFGAMGTLLLLRFHTQDGREVAAG